jgi:hypothetical protein
MHDGVDLETRGLPTAVVVTEAFVHEAHVQRAALGMEGLDPVVIDHPLSTLTDDEIDGRAAQAVDAVKKVWLGT